VQVETAENAPAALGAIYKASHSGHPFDLLLIDQRMPGMNGLTLTQAILADEQLSQVRIALMQIPGDRFNPATIRNGDRIPILHKPVRRGELRSVLGQLCGVAGQGELALRSNLVRPTRFQSRQLLLVEDNATNQLVALAMLRKLGLQADAAEDGAEALRKLAEREYELVLMDMRMPIMDGLEATRRIRAGAVGPVVAKIPIIAMTANVQDGDRLRCLDAGMNDFIPKPIVLERLKQVLSEWIATDDTEKQPSSALLNNLETTAQGEAIFDYAGVFGRLLEDRTLVDMVLNTFLEEAPRQMTKLREGLQREDAPLCARIAHSIKGAAANAGAEAMRQIALGIEKAADRGELHAVRLALPDLQDGFEAFEAAIRNFHQQSGS